MRREEGGVEDEMLVGSILLPAMNAMLRRVNIDASKCRKIFLKAKWKFDLFDNLCL